MSEARLVVHLGMPKTGTSLLQHSVMRARKRPGADHLVYPSFGRDGAVAHHDLARRLLAASETTARDLAGEVLADLGTPPPGAVVLYSSEAFSSMCGIDQLSRLRAFLETIGASRQLIVLLVLREMADFLESMYLQSSRVGRAPAPFETYLAARGRWARDLFLGIAALSEALGPAFRLEFQDGGFDILEHAEGLLGIRDGALRDAARAVPPTKKRSIKEQAVMAYTAQIEARLGFPIKSSRLATLFNSHRIFENDSEQYTLYPGDLRRETHARFLAIADAAGFDVYRKAFGRFRPRDLPVYRLAPELLSPADLEVLAAHRSSIADNQ